MRALWGPFGLSILSVAYFSTVSFILPLCGTGGGDSGVLWGRLCKEGSVSPFGLSVLSGAYFSTGFVSSLLVIYRLISISLANGTDLSHSNIERLKRKFRLNDRQDGHLIDLINRLRQRSLKLQSVLRLRRALSDAGHSNIGCVVKQMQLPAYLHELILLERW